MATPPQPPAPVTSTLQPVPSSFQYRDLDKTEVSIKDGELGKDGAVKNEEPEYPSARTVVPIVAGLFVSMFLVAFDKTIIATAIPKITDRFNSLDDVGWYGSAYLLANCATQLLYGRIYTFYSPRWVFLSALLLFEVGSALCGGAPNSTTFIVGRAIAGVGASGVGTGVFIILIPLVPLHKRPMLQGVGGGLFGIAAVAGPLVGGALTTHASWRWCFWINLPAGALSAVVILFILKASPPATAGTSTLDKIRQLDPFGTLVFLPAIICLVLGLQWGGTTYAWSNARIIALLTLFGVLIIAFVLIQWWQQENATIRPRIFLQRSIASAFFFSVLTGAGMIALSYFLPIWFQAIKGVSAVKSGILILPYILALVVGSFSAGFGVTKLGYYTPFMIVSSVIMSIGAGLLTTWQMDTNHQKWIGYQVLYGFGQGLGMQQPGLAAQAVLSKKDAPVSMSLMMVAQSLGGSISLAVAQNIFAHELVKRLTGIIDLSPYDILSTGATAFRAIVPAPDLGRALVAYNGAVVATFWVVVGVSAFSVFPASFMEWKNIKGRKRGGTVLSEEELAEDKRKRELDA